MSKVSRRKLLGLGAAGLVAPAVLQQQTVEATTSIELAQEEFQTTVDAEVAALLRFDEQREPLMEPCGDYVQECRQCMVAPLYTDPLSCLLRYPAALRAIPAPMIPRLQAQIRLGCSSGRCESACHKLAERLNLIPAGFRVVHHVYTDAKNAFRVVSGECAFDIDDFHDTRALASLLLDITRGIWSRWATPTPQGYDRTIPAGPYNVLPIQFHVRHVGYMRHVSAWSTGWRTDDTTVCG